MIGLLLSFAGKGKTASRNVLATSVLDRAGVRHGVVVERPDQEAGRRRRRRDRFCKFALGDAGGNPFGGGGAMGAQMVDNMLQERFGYWIAFSALIGGRRRRARDGVGAAAGATKPESEPPVV